MNYVIPKDQKIKSHQSEIRDGHLIFSEGGEEGGGRGWNGCWGGASIIFLHLDFDFR